jgi:hypothetical protein
MLGNQIRIAISGKKRTGKNEVSSLLVKHLGLIEGEYKITAFADRIKETICTMLPWVRYDYLYGASELREKPIDNDLRNDDGTLLSHRQAITDLGKLGRKYDGNLWIRHLDTDFQLSGDRQLYIVPDQRFVNEFQYLKKNGFYMVRVLRKGLTQGTDISETQQEEIPDSAFDWVIHNDCSLDVLSDEVKRIVEVVRLKTHS